METYKRGISLIVLVITVIVLGILATAVIISVNNTNLINESDEKIEKYNVKQYESQMGLAYASWLMENENAELTSIVELQAYGFDATALPARYAAKVENGIPVITTQTVVPADMKVGDLVVYTPDKSSTETVNGPTFDGGTQTTANYQPGSMTWAYLGQDENGNVLLVSQNVTSFNVTINGLEAWVYGPDRMDTLCNSLYGSSVYGKARNLNRNDVNKVLGYTGELGMYRDTDGTDVTTAQPLSFGEIQTMKNIYVSDTKIKPEGVYPGIEFNDILSDSKTYALPTQNTEAYQLILKDSNGNLLPKYVLSSSVAYLGVNSNPYARYRIACINTTTAKIVDVGLGDSSGSANLSPEALPLRPVIVLNSNIQFGAKNSAGAWSLTVMK